MKITSDENVNQAVEQMVQAIRNTDAYMEYRRQLGRIKEQPELKKQIDDFRTRNFELQTSNQCSSTCAETDGNSAYVNGQGADNSSY